MCRDLFSIEPPEFGSVLVTDNLLRSHFEWSLIGGSTVNIYDNELLTP